VTNLTLADIESAIRGGWALDTCDDVDVEDWTPNNPTATLFDSAVVSSGPDLREWRRWVVLKGYVGRPQVHADPELHNDPSGGAVVFACFAADRFGTVLTAPARPGQRLRLLTQPKNTNSAVRSPTAR